MSRNPSVVLVTRAEPGDGWGHAARMLALAEALDRPALLVDAGASGRAARTLPWPIPVLVPWPSEVATWFRGRTVPCVVLDLPPGVPKTAFPPDASSRCRLAFLDHGEAANGADIVVDCQPYAAERNPRTDAAVLYGPRWVPLRKAFRGARWVGGAAPIESPAALPKTWDAGNRVRALYGTEHARLPASVVGMEALCVGAPTEFYAPTPRHEPLVEAYTRAQEYGERPDGRGAERLAALISAECR